MKIFNHLLLIPCLLYILNLYTCHSMEFSIVDTATKAMTSSITTVGKLIWEHENKRQCLMELDFYDINEEVRFTNSDVQKILSDTPKHGILKKLLLQFERKISKIELYYKDILDYYWTYKFHALIAKNKMIERLYSILKFSFQGPVKLMNEIVNLVGFEYQNILDELKEKPYNYSNTCLTESDQQPLQLSTLEYLKALVFAEIKIYLMLNMAYEILIHHDAENAMIINSNHWSIIDNLKKNHQKIIKKFKKIAPKIPRDVWRCDPKPSNYKEDITYIKLKHVFVGLVRNQINLHKWYMFSCRDFSCGSINPINDSICKIKNYNNRALVCQEQPKCAGLLWNCHEPFGHQNYNIKICLSDENSERNYEFAEVFDQVEYKRYGLNDNCKKPLIHERRQCISYTFGEYSCCYPCYCICDNQLNYNTTRILSERMFYTKSVEADFSNNYVVTGARLRKREGVVYIQIQQGQLLENGQINKTTLLWKEEPHDSLINPKNHFILHWNARSIELGEIHIPPENVLIGLKFENETVNSIERLTLIALSRNYDYDSGKITNQEKEIFSSRVSSNDGFELRNFKLPDNLVSNQIVESSGYLNFSISNFESDLGQTTIPFIDIQDVITKEPFPMGGVGLYYRRSDDISTAGFLGLKLIIYDFSQNFPNHF